MAAGVLSSKYRALTSLVLVHASLLGKESVSCHPSDRGQASSADTCRYQPSSTAATPPAQLLASDMEAMFDDQNKTCFCKIFFDWQLDP